MDKSISKSKNPGLAKLAQKKPELANLRADTSIQKTILSKTIPNAKDMVPNIEIMRSED